MLAEYELSVRPQPLLESVRTNGYVYNRGQNVTLTCAMTKGQSNSHYQPYVFIHSCTDQNACNGWIASGK